MTTEHQIALIRYGEEIGILVTPIEQCDVKGVAIGKLDAFSFERAHAELTSLSVMTVPARQVAA